MGMDTDFNPSRDRLFMAANASSFREDHGRPWDPDLSARGFTLIELLVSIAIIGLLISILLPSLGRAREMGRRTVCSSNMRQIGVGFYQYSEDNNGWFPVKPAMNNPDPTIADLATVQQNAGASGPGEFWGPQFAGMIRDIIERDVTHEGASVPKYLANPKILICPSDQMGNDFQDLKQVPVRPANNFSEIQISLQNQSVKNYSYMYVALWRNDDRSEYFMLGDESNHNDVATNSLTGLTTEDNHGRDGINAMYVDTHVEWEGSRGGDYQSLQELANRLWGPAVLAKSRWPGTPPGESRSREVQTID